MKMDMVPTITNDDVIAEEVVSASKNPKTFGSEFPP
jgi:hypothetical protein